MKPDPGLFYTSDVAAHDEHGHIWIQGVIDCMLPSIPFPIALLILFIDVINVSGHRLSCPKSRAPSSCIRVLLRPRLSVLPMSSPVRLYTLSSP